jgi:hypothetical protein
MGTFIFRGTLRAERRDCGKTSQSDHPQIDPSPKRGTHERIDEGQRPRRDDKQDAQHPVEFTAFHTYVLSNKGRRAKQNNDTRSVFFIG